MTTERWTDEMLDRLVQSINNIAALTELNTRESQELRASVERLYSVAEIHQQTLEAHQQNLQVHQQNFQVHQQNFGALQQNIGAFQQSFNAMVQEIHEMQAEVRGLQTENRRILDQLINRDQDDNNQ